jgi:hypothetical protein
MRSIIIVQTTLDVDEDVLIAARELAVGGRRSLRPGISELARRGLAPARPDADGELPVIRVPSVTPPITPPMVRRALAED